MITAIKVMLYGRQIATAAYERNSPIVSLEYTNDIIESGVEPSPLLMPVKKGVSYSFANIGEETFKGLPGLLADSLPDTYGRKLFEQWLRITGRTSGNTLESLCFMGKRCMGALEFEPAADYAVNKDQLFEMESLIDVADKALNNKMEFSSNMKNDSAIADIIQLGTSAGGQRAKAVIAYNSKTGEIRSGQTDAPDGFEHYLIKLDGVNGTTGLRETNNYGRVEYSFYKLAKACGIDISDCSLLEENGRAHFMTKRFDRMNGKKIHMQTLCGIAHYDYRSSGTYSYEQAFQIMRGLHLTYSEMSEMFKRLVLNIVIRNQDDHTKNISFLMNEKGEWRLSPAYDVGFAYNPHGLWTNQHQMSVNNKFSNITRKDLLKLASDININGASEIIDYICRVAKQWPDIANLCGVPADKSDAIYNYFEWL
ncbi:MAG: type II toxin-antitoxin system HipA family toxin [Paludibacteraceae bacterium]|nr:type II toxin-antitoxin system HipA family toxin [Paludibacteraceae bacterium]